MRNSRKLYLKNDQCPKGISSTNYSAIQMRLYKILEFGFFSFKAYNCLRELQHREPAGA